MTIRLAWLSCLFSAVLLAQQPQDPSAPWPNHETPAKNWYCVPANKNHDPAHDAHACRCLGMQESPDPEKRCAMPPPNDDGSDVAYPAPNDNNKCKAWCHKDHCLCDTQCESSEIARPAVDRASRRVLDVGPRVVEGIRFVARIALRIASRSADENPRGNNQTAQLRSHVGETENSHPYRAAAKRLATQWVTAIAIPTGYVGEYTR